MAGPAIYKLTIYRGDDLTAPFSFLEPGGRVVNDLVLTSGDATATSASAAFVAADAGALICTSDGTGIADGTTILSVTNSTTVELSANATATGTAVASIRALDCSGFSAHSASLRTSEDAATATTITVTATRGSVGVFTLSIADTVTDGLDGKGVWDWQVTTGGNVRTLLRGSYVVVKDVSHA